MSAYSQLARLPMPRKGPVRIDECVRRVARLETRAKVTIQEAPSTVIQADADQLDQLLINLLKNAAEANGETGGQVRIGWGRLGTSAEIWVEDEGPGLSNTANLFVPFFTTKPKGTGIGLVLSRQIAEAHGGSLTLENRVGARGCIARLRLPTAVN